MDSHHQGGTPYPKSYELTNSLVGEVNTLPWQTRIDAHTWPLDLAIFL